MDLLALPILAFVIVFRLANAYRDPCDTVRFWKALGWTRVTIHTQSPNRDFQTKDLLKSASGNGILAASSNTGQIAGKSSYPARTFWAGECLDSFRDTLLAGYPPDRLLVLSPALNVTYFEALNKSTAFYHLTCSSNLAVDPSGISISSQQKRRGKVSLTLAANIRTRSDLPR